MVLETLKKLFTPVEALDADQVRAYIAEHKEGSFTLLDVRQPGEYEEAHIPGAKLIPIAQLPDRMRELDPEKPVIGSLSYRRAEPSCGSIAVRARLQGGLQSLRRDYGLERPEGRRPGGTESRFD